MCAFVTVYKMLNVKEAYSINVLSLANYVYFSDNCHNSFYNFLSFLISILCFHPILIQDIETDTLKIF